MPSRVRCFRRKRRHDGLRGRSCRCSDFLERSCGRGRLRRRTFLRGCTRRFRNLRGRGRRLNNFRGHSGLRGRARWLNNLRGRNCRYRLSAVHAEPCITGKFRAAFRAIHACHPLPDSLLFARYCKPRCIRHMPTAALCAHAFTIFLPDLFPFQEHALLYATQETLEQTKSIQRQLAYIGATSTIGAIEAWHK